MVARKIVAAVLLLVLACPAAAQEFTGPLSHVVDGDTFDIIVDARSVRFRLCGIDAPDAGETGYRAAKSEVEQLIGKSIRCVQVGNGTPCDGRSKPTNGNRIVAQCFVGTDDIAARLVADGLATDWPRFSGGHYKMK